MKKIHDPENYYKMSAPFETSEECNNAIEAFYKDLRELRNKHKMRDVLVVLYGSTKYEDGHEQGEFMQHSILGSSVNELPMAAYVFGQAQASNRERINKLISKGKS